MEHQRLHIKLNPIPVGRKNARENRTRIKEMLIDFCDIDAIRRKYIYIAYDDNDNYYVTFPDLILKRKYYYNQEVVSAISEKTKRIIPGRERRYFRDECSLWNNKERLMRMTIVSIPQKLALALLLKYDCSNGDY